MDTKLVANYFTKLKEKSGLTYEEIAERSEQPLATVKNLFSGKTENPGIIILSAIIYAMNGSIDEMLGIVAKNKNETEENFATAIKELCEYQLKMNETHINNIRLHYEQHRQDTLENYEKRLADKQEIIKEKDEHIKNLKKEKLIAFVFAVAGVCVLIGLLIAEVMNPSLGWLRF